MLQWEDEAQPAPFMHLTVAVGKWPRPVEQKVGKHHRFNDRLTDCWPSVLTEPSQLAPAHRGEGRGQRSRLEDAAVMGDCHGPMLTVQKAGA